MSDGLEGIDVELVFDRDIGTGFELDALQTALFERAPRWAGRLRIWRSSRDQISVTDSPGALRKAVLHAAAERGLAYRALVAEHGAGHERRFGSVELRGSSPELVVVVSVDEDPYWRIGGRLLFGNDIGLQIRRSRVGDQRADAWATDIFAALCDATSPTWGALHTISEYAAKVMSDGPGVAAIGRDFARHLPGLFAGNFFGAPYVDLIGRDRLLSSAASLVESVDRGVLLFVTEHPESWVETRTADMEAQLLRKLGPKFFFSKTAPPDQYAAPNWSP